MPEARLESAAPGGATVVPRVEEPTAAGMRLAIGPRAMRSSVRAVGRPYEPRRWAGSVG